MCIQAKESITAPITTSVSGVGTSQEASNASGWACHKTDCPVLREMVVSLLVVTPLIFRSLFSFGVFFHLHPSFACI